MCRRLLFKEKRKNLSKCLPNSRKKVTPKVTREVPNACFVGWALREKSKNTISALLCISVARKNHLAYIQCRNLLNTDLEKYTKDKVFTGWCHQLLSMTAILGRSAPRVQAFRVTASVVFTVSKLPADYSSKLSNTPTWGLKWNLYMLQCGVAKPNYLILSCVGVLKELFCT